MVRLDRFLSSNGEATRKETIKLVREHRITINGNLAIRSDDKIDEKKDEIKVDGRFIEPFHHVVIVMNKPAGYVTSTSDNRDKTVMELLPPRFIRLKVFPVGRLDKETEGLLLFTNDGELAHRLISPKKEIEKEYFVIHKGDYGNDVIEEFSQGLVLLDGTICKGAKLIRLEKGKSLLTIREGKYHQVRRMMGQKGLDVTYLERIREANITISGLERGEVRELSEDEIDSLNAIKKSPAMS